MNLIFSLNLKEGGRAGRRVMERQDGEITGLGNWDEGSAGRGTKAGNGGKYKGGIDIFNENIGKDERDARGIEGQERMYCKSMQMRGGFF